MTSGGPAAEARADAGADASTAGGFAPAAPGSGRPPALVAPAAAGVLLALAARSRDGVQRLAAYESLLGLLEGAPPLEGGCCWRGGAAGERLCLGSAAWCSCCRPALQSASRALRPATPA
jgi:hypothetical protein